MMLSRFLIVTAIPDDTSAQNMRTGPSPSGLGEYALLSPDELDGLVAPVAHYPDAFVAQVVGAATFPHEIVDAVTVMGSGVRTALCCKKI
jgi:hypothetical protein